MLTITELWLIGAYAYLAINHPKVFALVGVIVLVAHFTK